jgi:hypothetical protein
MKTKALFFALGAASAIVLFAVMGGTLPLVRDWGK